MKIRIAIMLAIAAAVLSAAGCMSEQERQGVDPKPFNSPAAWETNPYNGRFQN